MIAPHRHAPPTRPPAAAGSSRGCLPPRRPAAVAASPPCGRSCLAALRPQLPRRPSLQPLDYSAPQPAAPAAACRRISPHPVQLAPPAHSLHCHTSLTASMAHAQPPLLRPPLALLPPKPAAWLDAGGRRRLADCRMRPAPLPAFLTCRPPPPGARQRAFRTGAACGSRWGAPPPALDGVPAGRAPAGGRTHARPHAPPHGIAPSAVQRTVDAAAARPP